MKQNKKHTVSIVRPIDRLGRLSIPKDIRQAMRLEKGDALAVYVLDGGVLALKRCQDHCALCGATRKICPLGKRYICASCAKKLRESSV